MNAKGVAADQDRYGWRGQHRHRKVQSSDEGKVRRCGRWIDPVFEVVSEKDPVRLCTNDQRCGEEEYVVVLDMDIKQSYSNDTPRKAVDGKACGNANPAISTVRRPGDRWR